MLFKRARDLVSDVYYSLVHGGGREIAKCTKILKAIDDNSIDNLRAILAELDRKDVEDYLRRPVDAMRRTPLHLAAWAENADILGCLLDYVNESDVEDKTGATPSMFVLGVVGGQCLKKMTMLINKHANVNRKDKSGWTLLHAAVNTKRLDVLELLLAHGGNVQMVDGQGRSLLHIACDNGDLIFVKYLLEKNVSLASIDKNGWTPLHVACGPADDYELVRYLIQMNADPHARDINRQSPLHWAQHFKANKVARYLRSLENGSDESDDDDDLDSDFGATNGTYESDNVFESEPSSNRNSQKSIVSIPMVELSTKQRVVKL